jgi:host factor-I protein
VQFNGQTGFIMSQPSPELQNQFLQELCDNQTPISIYLVSGVRLHGYLAFFDNYIVAVRSEVTQLVYKHAISTVIPSAAEQPHPGHRKAHDGNAGVAVRTKRSRIGPATER